MKANVKVILVVDYDLIGTEMHVDMERAMAQLHKEVFQLTEGQTGITWQIVYHAFNENDIAWVSGTYNGKLHYYPTAAWVQSINDRYDQKNASVMLVIHPDNWKDPDARIGGINYFETQIIHPMPYWKWYSAWKLTIEHELLHSFDNRQTRFPGVDFVKAVPHNKGGNPVVVWDRDVVHETWPNSLQHRNTFDYVWDQTVEEVAAIYPNEQTMVDHAKLVQITNEILLRDPIPGEDDAYIGRPEAEVRAEVGATGERMKIIALVGAARLVSPL